MKEFLHIIIIWAIILILIIGGIAIYQFNIQSKVPQQVYILDTKIEGSLLGNHSANIYVEFITEFSKELSFHNLSLVQYHSDHDTIITFQPNRDVLFINNFTYGNFEIYENKVTNSLNVTFNPNDFVFTSGNYSLYLELSYSSYNDFLLTSTVFVVNLQ